MRAFLSQFPLVKQASGLWKPGREDFKLHEIWPLPTEKETVLASRVLAQKVRSAAKVIILREDGAHNMCWMLKEANSIHHWREQVYNGLDKPAGKVLQYALDMVTHYSSNFLVVQWRSLTNEMMFTLQNRPGGMSPESQHNHLQDCARGVAVAADHILERARLRDVVFFSDL